jgi:hypothetical protein
VIETAPPVLTGRSDQSPLHRIAVNVANHFGPVCFATNVRVKITRLPELRAISSQLAGSDLLERLQKLRQEQVRRLVDQQVNMFGHQHVSVNPGLMTCPGLFQKVFDRFFGPGSPKERKPVKAAERDEVKGFRTLEPLQAIGHGAIVILIRPRDETRSSR